MENVLTHAQPKRNIILFVIWFLIVSASILPDIIFREILSIPTTGLFWYKSAMLLLLVLLGYAWSSLKPLRYVILFLWLINIYQYANPIILESTLWRSWFGGTHPTFVQHMLGIQLVRVTAALFIIGTLFFLRFSRSQTYLVMGNLKADVQPISWLGIQANEITWQRFGWLSACAIGSGTLVFLIAGGTVETNDLPEMLRYLPFVVLFAALNAFAEEVMYRVALLASLRQVVSPQHAVLLTAIYFGIAHFYGVPYGVLGMIMAAFLGWLLGKSMVETQGFFWAWFIHFLQDVLIFSFVAVGFTASGG